MSVNQRNAEHSHFPSRLGGGRGDDRLSLKFGYSGLPLSNTMEKPYWP